MSRLDSLRAEMNESASKNSTKKFIRNFAGKTNSRVGRPSGRILYSKLAFTIKDSDWNDFKYICAGNQTVPSEQVRNYMEKIIEENQEIVLFYKKNNTFGKYYAPNNWKETRTFEGKRCCVIRIKKETVEDFATVCKCFGSTSAQEIGKFVRSELAKPENKKLLKAREE